MRLSKEFRKTQQKSSESTKSDAVCNVGNKDDLPSNKPTAMLAIEQNPETARTATSIGLPVAPAAQQTYEERMQAIRASISNPDPLLSDVSLYGSHYRF